MNRYVRKLVRGVRYGPTILLGGGVPESAAQWESEYEHGYWDRLHGVEQLPRYAVIAAYARLFAPSGRILDVGSGEGVLLEHLAPGSFSSYTGLDISEHALAGGRARRVPNTRWVRGDI